MTKEQVKAVLDRVLTWPDQRQEDAANMLALMETQDDDALRLTEPQMKEIRKRLADRNAPRLTLDEFNLRVRHRLGE